MDVVTFIAGAPADIPLAPVTWKPEWPAQRRSGCALAEINCRGVKASRWEEGTPICAPLETCREVEPLEEKKSAGG